MYRRLDIGTEKITAEEMRGVPHHLIDIRDAGEPYSAGDFMVDATRLISDISARGKLPILVGGTHFYFDALLNGLPLGVDMNMELREELEKLSSEELFANIQKEDPRRAEALDPQNRRRLVRALEIIEARGTVPPRMTAVKLHSFEGGFEVEWVVINPEREELRAKIDARLATTVERGLVEEVQRVRGEVGDARLNELGLEYRIVGDFLRGDLLEKDLLPTLSSKLWQYARRQKAWLRKLGH